MHARQRLRAVLPHVLLALVVGGLCSLGLSYRPLWQDEVETAERARSILRWGYPRLIDPDGHLSLNTGGVELEEGLLHRYAPWGQFYFAAAGLAACPPGVSRDACVRLPSALAHGAASGLLSFALSAYAGTPPAFAALAAGAFGLQTERLAHDRTARYHGLCDLLTALALLAAAASSRGRRWGAPLLGAACFLLPQVHPLGGLGVAAVVGAGCLLSGDRRAAAWVAAGGAASLAALLVLMRPWSHAFLTAYIPGGHPTVFADVASFSYALLFPAACAWLWRRKDAALLLLALVAVTAAMDRHPYSVARYYLPLTMVALFWPLALGAEVRPKLALAIAATALLPDLALGSFNPTPFRPFAGVRLAFHDLAEARRGTQQPLRQAVSLLRERGTPQEPILFDYVPQFANWYLPGRPIALLPDAASRTPLNKDNPVWAKPPAMPVWHVWYPERGTGTLDCLGHCDYSASDLDPAAGRYTLSSKRLGARQTMCVVASWRTHHLNNASFANVSPWALTPAGFPSETLIVARRCRPSKL